MLETGDEADALLNMLNLLGDEPSPAPTAEPATAAAPTAAPAPATVAVTPAPVGPTTEGWHPDPADPTLQRWFDGIRWTPATRPAAGAAAARFGLAPAGPGTPAPPPSRPGGARYAGPAPAPSWPPTAAPAWTPAPPAAGPDFIPPPPAAGPYGDIAFGAPPRAIDPRRGWVAALAVALAVLLIGGLGFAATHRPKPYPSAWDPRVSEIASFVESQRGAHFKHPVPVVFLSVADFKKKVARQSPPTSKERAELDRAAADLRALGLMSGRVDLGAAADKLDQESVIGLYDPDAKKVWVRGTDLTPFVRATLAHEMTHALQDQLFDLKQMRADTDADTPVRSLIEADAMRVERAYIDQLDDADRAAYDKQDEATQSGADISSVPDALTHGLEFPYVFGPAFEASLVAEGGLPAVDAAFRSPPQTEAEILNPRLYLDHIELAIVQRLPTPAGQRLVERIPFGQEDLTEVLAARIGFVPAWAAVQGWRGGRTVVSTDTAGKVCVAINVAMDSDAHVTALRQAAQQWAAAVKGASVVSGADRTVGMRSCDPGVAAKALPVNGPNAFDVLGARAGLVHELLHGGHISVDAAYCTVDAVMGKLGVQAFSDILKSDKPSEDQINQVKTALLASTAACGRAGGAAGAGGAPRAGDGAGPAAQGGGGSTVPQAPIHSIVPLIYSTFDSVPADVRQTAAAAGIKMLGSEGTLIHFHARVQIIDGDGQLLIPANLGIGNDYITELHTHDESGILHIEAASAGTWRLGQFFTEWGHPISRQGIGHLTVPAGSTMHVFVNGVETNADPATIVLDDHMDIAIVVIPDGRPIVIPSMTDWAAGGY
jgi:hypothetical protein